MARKYKTPKAIIKEALRILEDPERWTTGNLQVCIPALDLDFYETVSEALESLREEVPLAERVTNSERCAFCVLGAIREASAGVSIGAYEGEILKTPAGELVEAAAWKLFPKGKNGRENPSVDNSTYSRAVAVNDRELHKTARGSYEATLRVLRAALAEAS